MPCKHMFAVMENISGISWDSFCRQYKNSVYFKIDFEAIGIKEAVFTKKMTNLEHYNDTSTIPDTPEIFSKIPLPVYKKHSKASECREIMNQIKASTYIVTSESALTNLQCHLKEVLNILRKEAKSDYGLILNQREKHKDLHKKSCAKQLRNKSKITSPKETKIKSHWKSRCYKWCKKKSTKHFSRTKKANSSENV